METQYVTIWSKCLNSDHWVIERTHSKEYAAILMNSLVMDEVIEMNERYYIVVNEGVNPNTLFHYEMLDNL